MNPNTKSLLAAKRLWSTVILSFMSAIPLLAQTANAGMNRTEILLIVVMVLVLFVAVLILIIAIYLVTILRSIVLQESRKEVTEEVGAPEMATPGFFQRFMKRATDAVPVEKEETVLLDHDYDGIRELDNHLPPWWKWLFYVTIGWGAVYLLVYHVFGVFPLMEDEYLIEVEQAKIAMEERMKTLDFVIDENTVEFTDVQSHLANGQAIYDRECLACHGKFGEGLIGPNLTDDYWVHGGSIKDIFRTVKYGVPQKGMIAWQSKLNPEEMRDVSSYIMTMHGTNPPNAKAPEGTLYIPEVEDIEVDGDDMDSLKVATVF